jgi:hypothetical protein
MSNSRIPRHYRSNDNQVRNFSGVSIQDHRIIPNNAQSFNTTTKKMVFLLPRVGVLDGHRSYLSCDVNVAGGGCDHLASLFRKMKVWIGNVMVVDEDDFGWARTKEMDAYLHPDEVASASVKRTGYRQAHADDTTKTKVMPLADQRWWKRGFFAKKQPLFKMGQVKIEFELYDDLDICTSGDATAITVDNCDLHLYLLDSDSYRAEFSGDITGAFLTHSKEFRNLPNASTKINEVVPAHFNNVNFVILEQQLNSLVDLGVTTNNYNFTGNHTLNSINNIELSIDGSKYPQSPIETENTNDVSELVQNLQDCWRPNDMRLGSNIHSYADKSDETSMYIGVPLQVENKAISGKKLSDKSGSIVCKATCSVSAQTDLNIWTYYTRFYTIRANGSVSVSD